MSVSKFWKEALNWKLGGGARSAGITTFSQDGNGNVTGLVGPNGTAGYVDACLYGAKPGATNLATTNTLAINLALANGGLVIINTPGTYYINGTLIGYSNTRFKLAEGVIIRRVQNTNAMMFRNVNANSTPINITSLTTIPNTLTQTSAIGYLGKAVFSQAHGMAVGQYVFIAGAQPNDYNGIWKILQVSTTTVSGDTLLFAMAYYNGPALSTTLPAATVNAGTSGIRQVGATTTLNSGNIVLSTGSSYGFQVNQPISCTNFSGVQTITSVGANGALTLSGIATASTLGSVGVNISSGSPAAVTWATLPANGSPVYLTGAIPTGLQANVTYYVVGGSGLTSNLALTAGGAALATTSATSPTATVSATVTSNFYAYSSIIGALADFNIHLEGGTWYQDFMYDDGSGFQPNNGGLLGNNVYAITLNRVYRTSARHINFDNCYDAIVPMSVQSAIFDDLYANNCGSAVQLMSGGRDIRVSRISGQTHDVAVSFLLGNWYTWSANIAGQPQNYEFLTDVEGLVITDVSTVNSLYAIQLTGIAGVKFRDVKINGVSGSSKGTLVLVYDDSAIGAGTYINALEVSGINTDGQYPYAGGVAISGNIFSSVGPTVNHFKVSNGTVYCPTAAQASGQNGITIGSSVGSVITVNNTDISGIRFTSSSSSSNTAIALGSGALTGQSVRVTNCEFNNISNCIVGGIVNGIPQYTYSNLNLCGTSGALHYGLPISSSSPMLTLDNITNGTGSLFYNTAATAGTMYVNNLTISGNAGGNWLGADNTITSKSNWHVFWPQSYVNPQAFSSGTSSFTGDVRISTVATHTIGSNTTIGSTYGVGYAGYGYSTWTIVLTGDATGLLNWTFNSNFALVANSGQSGQVLTPSATYASKSMVLQFMYNGANGKWTQIGGPATWN